MNNKIIAIVVLASLLIIPSLVIAKTPLFRNFELKVGDASFYEPKIAFDTDSNQILGYIQWRSYLNMTVSLPVNFYMDGSVIDSQTVEF